MEQLNYSQPTQSPPDAEVRQPVAAPASNNKLLYVVLGFNMVLVGLVVFALFRGPSHYVPPGPGPGPTPVITEDVVSTVIQAEKDLAMYEAEISEQLGQAVVDGKITTSTQFASMAKAAQEKAEDKAFGAMNTINNKYINEPKDGKWDAQLINELQRLKAAGKRKVAK